MTMDIVKPEPKTELEIWERWKNNLKAQMIGESFRSKTINIRGQLRAHKVTVNTLTATAKYMKIGNIVYGSPFKNGEYGIRIVKQEIRIFPTEPILRYRTLSGKEKVNAVL